MRLSGIWIIGVSIVSVVVLVFILSNVVFVSDEDAGRCIDVNRAAGFIYDVCFDSVSNNIFMLVEGNIETYDFNSFSVEFVDSQFRRYELIYEDVDASQLYKFAADKSPDFVNLTLNVFGEFDIPLCEEPKRVTVRDCVNRIPGWGEGSLNGTVVVDYIPREVPARYNFSNFIDIEVKEEVWESFCKSEWECFEWEQCVDGIQRRKCIDLNGCAVSLNALDTVRICGEQCIEDWECEWSECINNITIPTCVDKNDCETTFIFPSVARCSFEEECRPQIRCEDWVGCDIEYSLFDLLVEDIDEIKGTKTRVCRDLNDCVEPLVETRDCSSGVDIYTSRFIECGVEFVGVYNSLDDSLIARIGEVSEENPYLNIYLDDGESVVCEHCFDGILDGDEEGLDCGGSCEDCLEKAAKEKGFWEGVWDFFG